MKKKFLSFIMAFMMVLSLVPVNTALADEADPTDPAETTETESKLVDQGKEAIDGILKAAPTVETYEVYSSSLASFIKELENLLKKEEGTLVLSDDDIVELDTYVAQKVTTTNEEGETIPLYESVSEFSKAYSAQEAAIEAAIAPKAQALAEAMANFLDNSFDKEVYLEVLELFNDKQVTDYYQDNIHDSQNDYVHFSNIKTLVGKVEKAEEAIGLIPALTSETVYLRTFQTAMTKADKAFDAAANDYNILQTSAYYAKCLPYSENGVGDLIENYEQYEDSKLQSEIEEAYYNVGRFSKMTDETKEKIKVLVSAVKRSEQNVNVNVSTLYNGAEILDLIDKYNNVVEFEKKADAWSDPNTLISTTAVAQAMLVYESYYESLDEETKNMVPDSYMEGLKKALEISTDAENLRNGIDDIGVVESEENFAEVAQNLEERYADYRTFLKNNEGVRGIADMITNADILDDETLVIALIKSIDQITGAGDMTLSANSAQLESVKHAYDGLKESLKPQIYNIEALNEVYEDAQSANKVIGMIASIQNNFTLEDQEYIASVREAYNSLSNNAKIYVGSSRVAALTKADEQLFALNSNVASRTSALISQIGKVTASSKELIAKARTSYNSLSATQKQMVTNYAVLTAAEEAYKKLDTTLDKASVTGLGSYTYSGNAIKPPVTVKLNDVVLVRDVDYTVVYSSNIDAGTAKIVLTGIGDYSGTLTKTFKINPISISIAVVSGYKKSYNYNRKAIAPSVTVKFNGAKLEENSDYTVKYVSNKNAGTAKIKVVGKGNYTGTITNTFKIKKISLKKAKFGSFQKRFYRTGKLIKPTLTIKWKGKKLKQGRDYVITYSNNRWVGTASMKITGTGNFKGSKKYNFTIY